MTSTPSTHRPRTLFPLTINFSVRYVVLTGLLEALAPHCEPILGLSWDDAELTEVLQATGAEVVRLPDPNPEPDLRHLLYEREVAFHNRLASPSRPIDLRRGITDKPASVRLRRWASNKRLELRMRAPGAAARVEAGIEAAYDRSASLAEHEAFLRDLGVEAVISITPYAAQESLLLPAAARLGLPLATSVLSFDNLTTRPPLPVAFERYLVWNQFNAGEIDRAYPELDAGRIGIVGPAQFDFYQDPQYVEDLASWQGRLGVPAGVPTIFFGAGPPIIAPHEPQYLSHLLDAIGDGRLPADTVVVLRRHPHDLPERWERFGDHPAVRHDDPGPVGTTLRPGQAAMGAEQIVGLCSTLAHTDVHVNVSSTLTLDGAFFGKPQIGPAYDVEGGRAARRHAAELYDREHFLPIVASGGLELPRSPGELVAQVASALADPERLAPQRREMLVAMCTYLDGGCTRRVATELTAFLDALP